MAQKDNMGGNPKVSKEDLIAAAKINKKLPIWGGHGDVNRMLKDNGLPELYKEEDEIKHKISKLSLNEKVVKPQDRKAPVIKQAITPIDKPKFYLVHGEKVLNKDGPKQITRETVENRSDLKHMFLKDKNETELEPNG